MRSFEALFIDYLRAEGWVVEVSCRLERDLCWACASSSLLLFLELFTTSFNRYCHTNLCLLLGNKLADIHVVLCEMVTTNLEMVHIGSKG
jgi:hypothetical protein